MKSLTFRILMLVVLLCQSARGASTRVTVGSKIFPESVILSQMAVQLMQAERVDAVAGPPMNGTDVLWQALRHGDVDVYPEYSGTILQQIFAGRAVHGKEQIRAALATEGIGMTESLGFNDTYAIGMAEATAVRLGVSSLTDLRKRPDLAIGFSNEFLNRPDGWPGLRAAYALPQTRVSGMAHDLAYRALLAGSIDATDLYSTDAEIVQNHLRVLKDDRNFFPEYQAVYLYRLDLQTRAPTCLDVLRRLEGRIDEPSMRGLNARVKIDRVPEADVAGAFLHDQFGLLPQKASKSILWQLLPLTGEHLLLVGISLAAALVVAIPLGVVAAEVPRIGHVVLAVVAVIYTIPSLALLVFMIPLLGVGGPPAVVALFLYSLMPIVRNTHAGIRGIPPALRESAEVLGLSRWARLRTVEIPMALPSILAGIKTAAVLNVGTATLGALVGAGGYGQPIFTGVTLGNTKLIMLGAVPAAVMALLFQGAFDLLEPSVVPRGLRLQRQRSA